MSEMKLSKAKKERKEKKSKAGFFLAFIHLEIKDFKLLVNRSQQEEDLV